MILKKHHANKLINIENLSEVIIPDNEFGTGDVLILFNNSNSSSVLKSSVLKTYKSGSAEYVTAVEVPPMCLINVVFVDSDTLVITRGIG